jgi:hypothetical protein
MTPLTVQQPALITGQLGANQEVKVNIHFLSSGFMDKIDDSATISTHSYVLKGNIGWVTKLGCTREYTLIV